MDFEIQQGENGFIVLRGSRQGASMYQERKFWVATSPENLSQLIKKLTEEQNKEKQTDGKKGTASK